MTTKNIEEAIKSMKEMTERATGHEFRQTGKTLIRVAEAWLKLGGELDRFCFPCPSVDDIGAEITPPRLSYYYHKEIRARMKQLLNLTPKSDIERMREFVKLQRSNEGDFVNVPDVLKFLNQLEKEKDRDAR